MNGDLLGFFLDRMARSYEEQIWAIALVAGMNAFVIGQAERLLEAVRYKIAVTSIFLLSFLALLFVWSRHFIYMHYNELSRNMIETTLSGPFGEPGNVSPILSFVAGWSGITLYTLIIIGMCVVALRMLRIKNKP